MMTVAVDSRPGGVRSARGKSRSRLPWKWRGVVGRVREAESFFSAMSGEGILEKMQAVRGAMREGSEKVRAENFLEDVFGAVCVAAGRVLGMRPFDVQIAGAAEMARGRIAEMATGEGKTLTATMPAALFGLSGRGVHVVTVNDYLAERDAQLMGPLYAALGLSVGVIVAGMSDKERRRAYGADVVYATNKELGFDFLRDQIKLQKRGEMRTVDMMAVLGRKEDLRPVMRGGGGLYAALVDEADSVLIDEARTPLIVAAGGGKSAFAWAYEWADRLAGRLRAGKDFELEPAKRRVEWTAEGLARLQRLLAETATPGLMNTGESWQGLVLNALKARCLYERERQYVVVNGDVIIVDEFTGRQMEGRTWAEGLQQAIQAKEKVMVTAPTKTLARTTYQHFFSRYEKLCGMTGTAATEAGEFARVYQLGVAVIPAHRKVRRKRLRDAVFRSKREKWRVVAEEILAVRAKGGRPILVGTASIADSEALSAVLNGVGISHEVLNARAEHAHREAEIVERAGEAGAVTIATNMAGRGTDIQLSAEAAEAGGLYVIGTQMHESRRIDRQLIGRCGRQGDPGAARFFLSLEDEILEHALERRERILLRRKFSSGWGKELPARNLAPLFAKGQRAVERLHWRQRKQLMEYEEWLAKIYYQMGEK